MSCRIEDLGLYLLVDERLGEVLRDIDHEVTHTLVLAHDIHVVYTGWIVLLARVNRIDDSVSEVISEVVDILLCIVCIDDVLKSSLASCCEVPATSCL